MSEEISQEINKQQYLFNLQQQSADIQLPDFSQIQFQHSNFQDSPQQSDKLKKFILKSFENNLNTIKVIHHGVKMDFKRQLFKETQRQQNQIIQLINSNNIECIQKVQQDNWRQTHKYLQKMYNTAKYLKPK